MNYQRIIVSGNANGDALHKTSKKGGVDYTVFSLSVCDAKGRTTLFPVIAFGERSKAVAKFITKGKQVLVDGKLDVSEKTPRFKIIAGTIELGASVDDIQKMCAVIERFERSSRKWLKKAEEVKSTGDIAP